MSRRKRILVICPHPENVAPGQRLKYEQYFDYFRAHGYDLTVSPFMPLRFWNIVYQRGRLAEKIFWTLAGYARRVFDVLRAPFYDGLYIFLWAVPFGPPLFEALFCALNRRIVYDIDDMVFLKPKSRANPIVAALKSSSRITYLMRHAKHVITCTPKLDEFARRFNSETTDISSTINTAVYLPVNRYRNDGPVTLGWSGSQSTVEFLHLLDGVLREVSRERDVRLLVIGDGNFSIPGVDVEAVQWCAKSEVSDLQRIDIGLYPLPDDEWVLGKSGLKALQYMALGIPTVATAVGANFRVVLDGQTGFLVRTPEEWKQRLIQLIDDPALRRVLGEAARAHVERTYSIRANRDTYLGIVSRVFGPARPA